MRRKRGQNRLGALLRYLSRVRGLLGRQRGAQPRGGIVSSAAVNVVAWLAGTIGGSAIVILVLVLVGGVR